MTPDHHSDELLAVEQALAAFEEAPTGDYFGARLMQSGLERRRGQILARQGARDKLGLEVGDDLVVEVRGREIVMTKPQSAFAFKPPRPRRDVGLTDRETTDAAWEEHVTEKYGSGNSSQA